MDYLRGLKENVGVCYMGGRLIPAGTGMEYYRKVRLATELEVPELVGPEEGEEGRPQPIPLDFLVDEEERPTM